MVTRRGIRREGPAALVALAVVGTLAFAGCAEDSSSGAASGGDGVEAGASKEDYQAAFEDVDPIELHTQTPAPKGSPTGKNIEEYVAAVEDWSDGKITFDVAYSNAVAEPTENDDALRDGRLDIASTLPIYEPTEYPANAALIEGGFISDQSAFAGALSSNAWPNEVAFANDDIMKEWDDHGIVPLVPVYNSGANAFFCADVRRSLDDIKGASVGTGGTAQTAQVEALGGSPASIPYTELFESLERGVVDCTVSSPTVAVLGGFASAAPNVTVDPQAGFALAPGTWAVSKTIWDGLPLVAQQLLWDRSDVFIGDNITEKIFPNNAEMAKTVKAAGGSVEEFDEDARTTLQEANATLLDNLRGTDAVSDGDALVDAMEAANEKWMAKVAELGYDEDVSYNDFDTWYDPGAVDLAEYTAAVMDEIYGQHRPS
jgi:TRAP-type C4-dicarboxylate transport system substrate-binding protein